jgi:hypothetical protein
MGGPGALEIDAADVVPVRWDAAVFRTLDAYERQNLLWTDPPIVDRVDVGHDVFIERLDAAVARKLSEQCSAGAVSSQVAQRYSFVRVFARGNDPRDFDEDQRLQIAIALSRLIRPTSVGLEESAQVWGPMNDASALVIRPGPITGPASEAYVADRARAGWLTPADGQALRPLLDAFLARGTPDRIMRGLWHHENAARALDMAKLRIDHVGGSLVARRYLDGYPALTAFCRRHAIGYEPPAPGGHYDFAPAQEMQHDTSPQCASISGIEQRIETASLVLCYSRLIFFQAYPGLHAVLLQG